MDIFVVFTFDAAHHLPNLPEGHKCARLHGHTFRVELHVSGPVDSTSGWVVDFFDLKKLFQPILSSLDHYYLNDIEGLENPTSENIARWIWGRLYPSLPILSKIVVQESPGSGAIFIGK